MAETMAWPDEPQFVQPSIWGDVYRDAGGIVVSEDYAEQQRQNTIDSYGYDAPPSPEPEPEPYSGGFVNLADYQEIVKGKLNEYEAYNEYVGVALPSQMRDMGYSDEEIKYVTDNFAKLSPPPPPDYGPVQNLWEVGKRSVMSGAQSVGAGWDLITGDNTELAQTIVDRAAEPQMPAPLTRFNEALQENKSGSYWEGIGNYINAAREVGVEGSAEYIAQQAGQTLPTIAGGLVGAAIGYVLKAPRVVASLGAGGASFLLEAGSVMADETTKIARERGITDAAGIQALLEEPETRQRLKDAAVQKGIVVGSADAALTAITAGMGTVGRNMLRNGRRVAGGALIGGGALVGPFEGSIGEYASQHTPAYQELNPGTDWDAVAGELVGDTVLGGASSVLGSLIPSQSIPGSLPVEDAPDDDEASIFVNQQPPPGGPGAPPGTPPVDPTQLPLPFVDPNVVTPTGTQGDMFADPTAPVMDLAPGARPPPPAAPLPPDPTQGVLPLGDPNARVQRGTQGDLFNDPNEPPVDLTPPPRPGAPPAPPTAPVPPAGPRVPTDPAAQIPLPLNDPNLPPARRGTQGDLFGEVLNLAPTARPIEPPPPVPTTLDLNDPANVSQFLFEQGVVLSNKPLMDAVATVMAVRGGERQLAIADAVENLQALDHPAAEPLAKALLQISRSLPKDRTTRARAEQLLQDAVPGTPAPQVNAAIISEVANVIVKEAEAKAPSAKKAKAAAKDRVPGTAPAGTPVQIAEAEEKQIVTEMVAITRAGGKVTPEQRQKHVAALDKVKQAKEEADTGRGVNGIIGFVTAKGSTYIVHDDGTTTRNKTARPEHPGEQGVQPRSDFTGYVEMEAAKRNLSIIQATTPFPVAMRIMPDGKSVGMMFTAGPNAGKVFRDSVTPFSRMPTVGLIPIEGFRKGAPEGAFGFVHFGNPIVALQHAKGAVSATTQPAPAAAPQPAGAADAAAFATTQSTPDVLPVKRATRGLRNDERVPDTSLGGLAGQLGGQPADGPQKPARKPRGGLRDRVDQEGAVGGGRSSPDTGGEATTAAKNTADAGAKPNSLASPRRVQGGLTGTDARQRAVEQAQAAMRERAEQGSTEVAPEVKRFRASRMFDALMMMDPAEYEQEFLGRSYDQDMELYAAGTGRGLANKTVKGSKYGNQKQDLANKEAIAQQRADKRAKAAARRALEEEPVSEDDYEETYPGRDLGKDSDEIFSAAPDVGDPTAVPEPPIEPRVLQSFTRMPFSSVMNYLSSVLPSPLQRMIAARIEALGISVPITVGNLPNKEMGQYIHRSVPGQPGTAHIVIDPKKGALKTVLHEGTHAATVNALRSPKTPQQERAGRKIRELYAYVKKVGSNDLRIYGMKDEYEFVAEAFSNPEFQKMLSEMKLPGAPEVSVWTAFKQAVMQLLGSRSVLSDVLMHGEDLLSAEQPYEGSGAYAAAPNKAAPSKANRGAPQGSIVGIKNDVRTHMAYPDDKNDPNTKFRLYKVVPGGDPRGDSNTKVAGLTRDEVEQRIRATGANPLAPTSDTQVDKSAPPKDTASKKVGYDATGQLRMWGFQQKDGSWTLYTSDKDVRNDPNTKIHKDLSQAAVQRAITGASLVPVPPVAGAVQANGTKPTPVGYAPVGGFEYEYVDEKGPVKAVGLGQKNTLPSENVGITATLRNSEAKNQTDADKEKYVKPVAQMGKQLMKQFGKSEPQILQTVIDLHTLERMQKKINQTLAGKDDQVTQDARIKGYREHMDAAKDRLDADRASLPNYVKAVERDFAPLWKRMTDNNTDRAAGYGRITYDLAQTLKNGYDYYVPLQKTEKTSSNRISTGLNVETDRSFQRVIEQLERTIAEGEDNKITKSIADLIRTKGIVNTKNGEPVGTVGPGVKITYDPETNSLSEGVDSHTFDKNSIFFYENGERVAITIANDPTLLKALNQYKGEVKNEYAKSLMAVSSWLNSIMAMGHTSLNPAFMFGNFQRDVQAGNINLPPGVSRVRFNANVSDPRTLFNVATNVGRELIGQKPYGTYADSRKYGGFIDHRDYVGLQPLANDFDAYFMPTRSLAGWKAIGKKVRSKTFETLSIAAQISESVPRYAMYKAAYDSYMDGKADTPANRHEANLFAAHAAKTALVNFEQRGRVNLSSWWMFGNAKIQGLNSLQKTYKRAPVKTVATLAGITALGYALAKVQMDCGNDKDGKPKSVKISDQTKDGKAYMCAGGWAMTLNQELVPFYAIGHALAEYASGHTDGAHTASRIVTSFFNNLDPGNVPQTEIAGYKANPYNFFLQAFLPTLGVAPMQLAMNENTFGTKIIPGLEEKQEKGIPKSQMGTPEENQLAVNLRTKGYMSEGVNKLVEASPVLAAQAIYEATGGKLDPGPQQLRFINNYFNPTSDLYAFVRDITGGREPKYEGDKVNPVMRRMTANATPFYDQQQFDELLANARRAYYKVDAKKNPQKVPIETLSPEEQVLARSAKMLEDVVSDGKKLFTGSQFMTQERRNMLGERKREKMLEGIRRYNEARNRAGLR